jgi:uncharacterized damage-inducible protein DinB
MAATGQGGVAPRSEVEAGSEVARIVQQLEQAHEGGAWHGPSVGEALQGVSAAGAARRPIGSAHCIWELVHHVRVTDEAVRRHVTGASAGAEPDWPTLTDTSETAWRSALEALRTTQRALRDAVSSLPEARLHETIPGQGHYYWHELLGILHHDLYHAGQISLLKKAL